jgi:hypothetical protein
MVGGGLRLALVRSGATHVQHISSDACQTHGVCVGHSMDSPLFGEKYSVEKYPLFFAAEYLIQTLCSKDFGHE